MKTTNLPHISLTNRYILGVILILVLSLLAFYLLMNPPMSDFGLMAVFLSITAIFSALVGYGLYRTGWLERTPTIRWTLLGAYAVSSILTFINVWLTAELMFANDHDLELAIILLFFAGGMAMVLGYIVANVITDRIRQVERAAREIAAGDLEVRVPVEGRDEVAGLARTFNQMAVQLQVAAQKQEEVENLRRDLIAWVSHDLQTPLASIRAIVEALADGMVEDPETIQRYLQTTQKDIRALSILIDDLLQMAQLDAGGLQLDWEYNSLSDLVSDTLESFSELATRKGVKLSGGVEAKVDPVYLDAQRIGRVLSNLINNAVRHTPAGGSVDVRAFLASQGVRVEIHDSGEGIRPQDQPYVFDRFYRGEKSRSRSTGGSGLGLAIAKGIVEAHGGQIGLDSLPGKTCFYFVLPAKNVV